MLTIQYMSMGLKRDRCLAILGLSKNQLYHKATEMSPGRRPTTHTAYKDRDTNTIISVDNSVVVSEILEIKRNPDLSHWYKLIWRRLQVLGYYINHKKVYRLMCDYHLLGKARKKKGRKFVQFRRVLPEGPLRVLEMDIKYIWVEGLARYCYVLTVIDTFTRYVLDWAVGLTMRQEQVRRLWERIIVHYLQPQNLLERKIELEVRNDNGKQFSSIMIQSYFEENHLNQVFTHPYSPEENGHVESFHKTLDKALEHFSFGSLKQVENRLEKFYNVYNNDRNHSSIAGLSPAMFWALYEGGKISVVHKKHRSIKFRLEMAYQDLLDWSSINQYKYRVMRA